ncbi:30S ribosomal protein S6--L-glutamate ligase [Sneathiella sp. P13V-1]|uniref:30S ribosomal protein S6--L-glutamate ligase n=1 Tax=Sneathiella sp. P13V-1 TaxID=2697366 RepID=UPI00187B460A|nr:30S ribosomal protein S6--L-glutamate ligase [Sneathiella sp. P13V-1]
MSDLVQDKELIIGWDEWVSLPQLGLPAVKVKVDTGARTSSIHAFMIEPFTRAGKSRVRFGIHPLPERPDITVFCTADLVDQREITSSNGESEVRYVVKTLVRIGGQEWPIEISLTNRENMQYRMLLGRTAIGGNVIVDPNLSCVQGELSAALYDELPRAKGPRKNLKIGILTREPNNYSSERLVAAAEERGHLIELINTTSCYINITSHRPEVHLGGKSLEGFDAIIPRIGASITFYGMAVVRQFEAMGVYCLNSASAIGASRDKLYAHQLLARAGIGMPDTGFARSPKATDELIKFVGGAPLVVKLLEGTQGKGVVLTETKKAAESVIDAFQGLKANILVQEFIKEAAGSDIRCFVVGNKVVAAMRRESLDGDFRANLHQGGQAKQIRLTKEERATAVRAAKVMGLSMAGVDLLRSDKGPKVLEVNSSPGLEGIEKVTKKKIADLVIEHIEKNARPPKVIKPRRL